jgi:hypothetical protein
MEELEGLEDGGRSRGQWKMVGELEEAAPRVSPSEGSCERERVDVGRFEGAEHPNFFPQRLPVLPLSPSTSSSPTVFQFFYFTIFQCR